MITKIYLMLVITLIIEAKDGGKDGQSIINLTGYLPCNIYPFKLSAGERIYAQVYWQKSLWSNFDIMILSSGENLYSKQPILLGRSTEPQSTIGYKFINYTSKEEKQFYLKIIQKQPITAKYTLNIKFNDGRAAVFKGISNGIVPLSCIIEQNINKPMKIQLNVKAKIKQIQLYKNNLDLAMPGFYYQLVENEMVRTQIQIKQQCKLYIVLSMDSAFQFQKYQLSLIEFENIAKNPSCQAIQIKQKNLQENVYNSEESVKTF